tara:strand:+ start:82 stop:258 length:177 start_codon:yes stop_codon:yes gene_type:complete
MDSIDYFDKKKRRKKKTELEGEWKSLKKEHFSKHENKRKVILTKENLKRKTKLEDKIE